MGFELTVSNVVSQPLMPVFHHILACLSVEKVTGMERERRQSRKPWVSPSKVTRTDRNSLSCHHWLVSSSFPSVLSLSSYHPSCALSLIWELTVKWMPGGFLLPPPLLYHRQRKKYSTARVALLVHLLSVCTESVSVLLSGVSDCWLVPHMLADRKAGVWDGSLGLSPQL